jgi:acetolactate decarboxylase
MRVVPVILQILIYSTLLDLICSAQDKDLIYQVSTITALQEGDFGGHMSLDALKKYGDFGIGTYDGLEGEMVEADGIFYQITADGKVRCSPGDALTPFAMTTFFEPDTLVNVGEKLCLTELEAFIDSLLPSRNIFYAIRIDGTFMHIKARSVPKQTSPFPRLAEAVKQQSVFEFENLDGTIVGFRLPEYIKGISTPGYHLHFLSVDKKSGGHLLECRLTGGRVMLDYTYRYELDLPLTGDFLSRDLGGDRQKELEEIEK